MNRVKRVLVCCLLVVLCLGMVPFVPAYAETELFTIKDKSGNCYVPVATNINVKDTLGVDKVYCLWVPEETGALTIETSNFSSAQCFCVTSPLTCSTEESGKMIVSVGSGHDPNSCLAGVADTYPGANAYIDEASAVERICVELVGETTVDILIQRGGKKLIADPIPFTIKDGSGNSYVPVATNINVKDTLGVDKVYCLWVPEETGALTIETSNFSSAQCFCVTSPLTCSTEESGKMIVSVGSGHDPNSCLAGVADTYPGADAYIDEASAVERICVELVGETTVDILIQRGGKNPQDDVTPPVITLADNGVERTSDATATIKFTSSEAGTVYYSLVSADAVDTSATGTTMVSGDNRLNIVGLSTGEAKVYIKAKDVSGNVTESVLEVTVPAYVPTYEVLLTSITPAMYNQGYRYVSATAAGLPLKSNDDPYMCIYKGAQAGQTVKVTLLIPEADKELESISLTTNDGNNTPIDVTVDGTENSFSFTMPAANVRADSFTIKDSVVVRYNLKADVSLLYENLEDSAGNRQGTVTFTDADGVTLVQAKPRQQVTVTADPKPYTAGDMFKREFVRWKVIDGIEVSPEDQLKPSFTFEMPENDVYLFAEFKNVGTEITWGTKIDNVIGNVTRVSLSGVASERSPFTFAEGAELGAVPLGEDWWYRYEFTGWTVTRDEEVLTDVDTSQLVSDDRPKGTFGYATWANFSVSGKKMTVMANFHERAFASVTAAANDAAMGSATVTVGGSTPAETQSVVYEGQTVTLTATPGDRYTLKNWEVKDADGTEIKVTKDAEDANKATFIMPNNGKAITATAIFAVDPAKASTDCVLEDVDLKITGASVKNKGPSYTITVPANTDADTLAAAVLKFTVSEYADVITADGSVWPEAGQACGMELNKAVTFTVRSEKCRLGGDDAAKAEYTITVVRAKSTQCAIDSAKLGDVDGVIDQTTVTFTVPADTEDSAVATMPLTFNCSQYASIKLKDAADWDNGTACGMALNEEKTFVVTAEDGTTKAEYTVVIHRTPSDKKALTGATLGDIAAVIDEDSHAVTFTVPSNTTDSTLGEMILKFTCSPRAAVRLKDAATDWPAAGLRSGLKLGVSATFVVTAEDTSTQEYTVTVNRELSTEKAITEAVLTKTGGASVKADINEQNKTVTFTLPVGTTDADVAAMTLKFTCSQYASIKLDGETSDWPTDGKLCGMKLNEAKTFIVTAENGKTQAYTVLITRGKSTAKEITSAILLAKAGDTTSPATVKIDNAKKTIDFTLPAGTDTSKLGEMILKLTVSDYATVKKSGDTANWPAEGKACGMELDKAATFTVTAENGSTQDYKVTITRTKSTTKDITAVKLLDADKSVIAEGKLSGTTWTITLPSDTDKALINRIGSATDVYMQVLHTGVSVRQEEGWNDADGAPYWNSGDAMCGISVNTSKKFTVTAEDGSTKIYTVAIEYTAPAAPTLSDGSAARSSKTAATVKFTTNEAGTYYYKVVTHGAAAPTVDEIKKSTTKGTASAGETTFTLSNLTEDARDIYIVVVSASGGESTALKIEIPAYGGGTETPDTGKFTITANAPKGGTITTNRTKADKGDEIIVTVTPDSGYQMVEGSLSYSLAVAGGETVKITGNRFTMPGGNVTITCKWETATTTAKGITSFSINGVAGAVNNTTNTITITMPRGTDVTKLTPTISTNGVKSLTPGSGETVNFTNSVNYTATMEDGSTKTYTVTVYVEKGTLSDQFWDKLTDFVNQIPWWEYAKHQQSTSSYPKYW